MIGLNLLRVTIAMVAATLTFISFLSIDDPPSGAVLKVNTCRYVATRRSLVKPSRLLNRMICHFAGRQMQ
jgi:hypothetical protein